MKHPTQEGKYCCPLCDYGHDKGVSRQSVYKHHNKVHKGSEPVLMDESEPDHFEIPAPNPGTSIPIEEDEELIDFSEWDSIPWMEPGEEAEVKPHTIPDPIKKLAGGKDGQELLLAHRTMTKSMIRWSFLGLDRTITWWGRGVTNNPNYKLERTREDYDVLQNSTMTMLDAYGIQIPSSPLLVWSTIMASAYVPAVVDIQKNADPSKKGIFRAILSRLPIVGKRFRKAKLEEQMLRRSVPP